MLEWLQKYDYLIIPYLTQIGRVLLIAFASLGVVSVFGRMLEVANSDRSRNAVAIISMIILSLVTGMQSPPVFSYEYFISSFFFFTISVIFYVAVCWRLYPRIDALMDKKIAPDDQSKEIEDEKRKVEALMRKTKREEKKVLEDKKVLERKEKRLTKKK